jgi:hypothetical protein
MMKSRNRTTQSICAAISTGLAIAAMTLFGQQPTPTTIAPKTMPKLGTADPSFVSYNVEMVEVTGGCYCRMFAANANRQISCFLTPTP